MQIALTIAGFDPSSGAGITADLAVFAAHGLFGTACVTATTVQSTQGVHSVHPLAPELVRETLEELCRDLPPAGVKIGMLANDGVAAEVAQFLAQLRERVPVTIVLDPVLRSSSGHALLAPEAVDTMRRELLPLVDWITPNGAELEALMHTQLPDRQAIEDAARALQQTYPSLNLVVTGGDQERPDDLLAPARATAEWLTGERIATRSTHGTGCAFSSAFLANLLHGHGAAQSGRRAKGYVEEALRRAPGLGEGRGPLNLRWPLRLDHKPL